MSRKTSTVVTLQIRLQVPEGSNTAAILAKVRELLMAGTFFEVGDLVVKLVKKETTYA